VAEISDKLRRRLTQLHAMLGTPNAHEREAAWQKLDEALRKHKLTWNDLSEILQTGSDDTDIQDDPDPTPGQQPGDTRALECVQYILQQYVDLKPHEYLAVALWILHTHTFDHFMISPRLAITSPVRGCGKTTLLALIEALSARAERMDGVTPAAIFRMIDAWRHTLLIDEADNLDLKTNGTLRAVINSGHRKGGKITRVIQDAPKRFSTFAPMAIAAIGVLPLPTMGRSIVIHMERTDGKREFKRLDGTETAEGSDLVITYRQIFQWG
jgi:hypothetical protein